MVPHTRIQTFTEAPTRKEGQYVLYWMDQARRPTFNYALQRAARYAVYLRKPLLVVETVQYTEDDALLAFQLDGMTSNAAYFSQTDAHYYAFYERAPGLAPGLIAALIRDCAAVICDIARHPEAAVARARGLADCDVRCEQVDAEGLIPVQMLHRAPDAGPESVRAWAADQLLQQLADMTPEDPMDGRLLPSAPQLPASLRLRWPALPESWLRNPMLARSNLGCAAQPAVDQEGGWVHARWLGQRVVNEVVSERQSVREALLRIEPWLEEGYVSPFELLFAAAERDALRTTCARLIERKTSVWHENPIHDELIDALLMQREVRTSQVQRTGRAAGAREGESEGTALVLSESHPEPPLAQLSTTDAWSAKLD